MTSRRSIFPSAGLLTTSQPERLRFNEGLAQAQRGNLHNLVGHTHYHISPQALTNIKEVNSLLMGQFRQAYNSTAKIRIAYIRLEVVHHFLHPDPASNLTQWDIIDCNLEHMQRQSDLFRNAFARLVVQKDRELFGTQEFSAITRKAILLPTDDNVQTGNVPRRAGPYLQCRTL
ncbi:hypothetical protein PCASD_16843 [Puccinia coronata f. sp. avenae]|uniref:Uncharacterized protein n=1 Tax=Puccinia coronata f. sp. avenae TaxID=200324 RepID=A0A2N5U4L7_9BASI|nr:hypothetical protein PCASD_16843 [Puccinia coronata f. sp. avenae]